MGAMCLHPDACPAEYKHLHTSWTDLGGPIPFVTTADSVGVFQAYQVIPPYSGKQVKLFPAVLGKEGMKGMPRTYMINAGVEHMVDDARVVEEEMREIGVEVKREVMPGLPHYFWLVVVRSHLWRWGC
jgi:acetyl esterase/lipase